MHATHQFFLTKRSVYILVLNARTGEIESKIHYWLQTIQSFGGDSPVLIVTTAARLELTLPAGTRMARTYLIRDEANEVGLVLHRLGG